MIRSRRRLLKRRTYLHCSGCKTARRHCAAACWQVTGKLKRIDTRYGRHMLCRVFLVGRPLQLRNPPDGGVARSSPKGEPCLKEELPQLHRPLKRRGETAPSGREPFLEERRNDMTAGMAVEMADGMRPNNDFPERRAAGNLRTAAAEPDRKAAQRTAGAEPVEGEPGRERDHQPDGAGQHYRP